MLLSGCLQRGVPEPEAPAHSLARSTDEGLTDAGSVAPCPKILSRFMADAFMQDGGVRRRVRSAPGSDGGLGADGGSAPVMGSLSPDVIRKTIRMNRDRLLACYDRVLELQPQGSPGGTVTVKFVIWKTGEVCAAEVSKNTVKEPGLERCVRDAVTTMRFPPPRGGGQIIVTYPFIFRPVVAKDGGVGGVQADADAGPEEASQ